MFIKFLSGYFDERKKIRAESRVLIRNEKKFKNILYFRKKADETM